ELGGVEATIEVRKRDKKTPIVALTANVVPEEKERCFASGMNGYLSKPFKAHELFGVVEGWSRPETPTPLEPVGVDPVDLAAFRSMLSDAGIEESGDQMLRVYLESTGERAAVLVEAARTGDLRTAEAVSHQMKSSSASIHAMRLTAMLKDCE